MQLVEECSDPAPGGPPGEEWETGARKERTEGGRSGPGPRFPPGCDGAFLPTAGSWSSQNHFTAIRPRLGMGQGWAT